MSLLHSTVTFIAFAINHYLVRGYFEILYMSVPYCLFMSVYFHGFLSSSLSYFTSFSDSEKPGSFLPNILIYLISPLYVASFPLLSLSPPSSPSSSFSPIHALTPGSDAQKPSSPSLGSTLVLVPSPLSV